VSLRSTLQPVLWTPAVLRYLPRLDRFGYTSPHHRAGDVSTEWAQSTVKIDVSSDVGLWCRSFRLPAAIGDRRCAPVGASVVSRTGAGFLPGAVEFTGLRLAASANPFPHALQCMDVLCLEDSAQAAPPPVTSPVFQASTSGTPASCAADLALPQLWRRCLRGRLARL